LEPGDNKNSGVKGAVGDDDGLFKLVCLSGWGLWFI